MSETKQKYNKMFYSGTCVCGHRWDKHHLGMVANMDYYNQTGEGSIAQECEAYGFNEWGGLDAEGEPHCFGYLDKDDPDTEEVKLRVGSYKLYKIIYNKDRLEALNELAAYDQEIKI